MKDLEPRRVALFLLVSAVLVGSALLFARGGSDAEPPPAGPEERSSAEADVPAWAEEVRARAEAREEELRESARRFLGAFGRYAVGDLSARVKEDVRATSTGQFAAKLLGSPPAPPPLGGFVGKSRIASMYVTFLSGDATKALVSGDLKRGVTPEEYGFVFERRGGRWLAAGAGQ